MTLEEKFAWNHDPDNVLPLVKATMPLCRSDRGVPRIAQMLASWAILDEPWFLDWFREIALQELEKIRAGHHGDTMLLPSLTPEDWMLRPTGQRGEYTIELKQPGQSV